MALRKRFAHGLCRDWFGISANILMKLIDKENYLAIGAFDFSQDGLQAAGELAAIFRFGCERIEAETEQALIA